MISYYLWIKEQCVEVVIQRNQRYCRRTSEVWNWIWSPSKAKV